MKVEESVNIPQTHRSPEKETVSSQGLVEDSPVMRGEQRIVDIVQLKVEGQAGYN